MQNNTWLQDSIAHEQNFNLNRNLYWKKQLEY